MTVNWPPLNPDYPAQYCICAQGPFNPCWLEMLSGEWTIADDATVQLDVTILVGQVLDQAALLGVLEQLYCLGLPLLSVECLWPRPCSGGQRTGQQLNLAVTKNN